MWLAGICLLVSDPFPAWLSPQTTIPRPPNQSNVFWLGLVHGRQWQEVGVREEGRGRGTSSPVSGLGLQQQCLLGGSDVTHQPVSSRSGLPQPEEALM